MLDRPKVETQPFKKGGKVKKQKQKQKQKQTQRQNQIVNVNIGNKGIKKSYTRRQQQQSQRNIMNYPPPITTIIQNPNQPQQLPDMMTLLNLLNSQGMKAPQQKTINELRLENLEKENLNKTTKEQLKNLNEEKKPFTPEEEEEYYNNFLDDDFRNVNIMNAPIGNPLADNNKLPSLSLNSDSLSQLSDKPLRPLPPLPNINETEYDDESYPSVNSIREMAKNNTNRPLTIAKAKEEILNMDVGYTDKMLNKLTSSELNFLVPYIKSRIKDINRGEGQKKKGRPRKSN